MPVQTNAGENSENEHGDCSQIGTNPLNVPEYYAKERLHEGTSVLVSFVRIFPSLFVALVKFLFLKYNEESGIRADYARVKYCENYF